ncbi:SDR family oxidoreductase [Sphingomonas sp. PL-96]|uniref:SDR family oxidoreductase n=1 Tax=Sphingomonas sp. PL-96 TaxID=2887201 RepID=UPI001E40CED1|nr:SDR family oxidoreductase [Sphingomonas sp. PL-96]MCC2976733.1 SDR family oxidoreductase [Sphingomonas sp. PL-96]
MTAPVSGSVALVTGSARGIGKAIAARLGRDGHQLALNDVEANRDQLEATADELRGSGATVTTAVADVSQPEQVKAMVDKVAADLGQLNVMVANAGIARVTSLLEMDPEEWDQVMNVNVRGTFLCYKAAAEQMIKQGNGGKIIGAASIVAFRPFALLAHYSASKWAVRGLTQAAAMEWAKHGITVNAYGPGIVGTAMWDLIDEKLSAEEGIPRGEALKKYSESILMGRVSEPDDVAKLVSYLASPDSDYMTGQTVLIDGGIQFS